MSNPSKKRGRPLSHTFESIQEKAYIAGDKVTFRKVYPSEYAIASTKQYLPALRYKRAQNTGAKQLSTKQLTSAIRISLEWDETKREVDAHIKALTSQLPDDIARKYLKKYGVQPQGHIFKGSTYAGAAYSGSAFKQH